MKDILEVLKMLDKLSVNVCQHMANETYEKYDLDECPEDMFSTFLYGMIHRYFINDRDGDIEDITRFIDAMRTSAIEADKQTKEEGEQDEVD